jgi:hypothetical protein
MKGSDRRGRGEGTFQGDFKFLINEKFLDVIPYKNAIGKGKRSTNYDLNLNGLTLLFSIMHHLIAFRPNDYRPIMAKYEKLIPRIANLYNDFERLNLAKVFEILLESTALEFFDADAIARLYYIRSKSSTAKAGARRREQIKRENNIMPIDEATKGVRLVVNVRVVARSPRVSTPVFEKHFFISGTPPGSPYLFGDIDLRARWEEALRCVEGVNIRNQMIAELQKEIQFHDSAISKASQYVEFLNSSRAT